MRSSRLDAVGLAAAAMAANLVALVFTVSFTRLLGTDGYGALAALVNLSVILFVPGSALQAATAREGTLGRLGQGGELAATLLRWTRRLLAGLAVAIVLSILARGQLAALLSIDEEWAAAAVPATGVIWLALGIQRGLLQAAGAYRVVGLSIALEAAGRLAVALALVGAGLGVTGAYLGTVAAMALTTVVVQLVLLRRLGPATPGAATHPLRVLARDAAAPIAVLTLVAVLQNIDVIMARHALDEDAAGVYAACAVAAKAVVWIALGLGMWVLPEAARTAVGGADPRAVLLRALSIVGALAAVALTIFALAPELLLGIAFGSEYERGAEVLLALGIAFSLLAATYLGVQYLLGLGRRAFALGLGLAALAEPLALLGADTLGEFAAVVLVVQSAGAVVLLACSLSTRRLAPAPA